MANPRTKSYTQADLKELLDQAPHVKDMLDECSRHGYDKVTYIGTVNSDGTVSSRANKGGVDGPVSLPEVTCQMSAGKTFSKGGVSAVLQSSNKWDASSLALEFSSVWAEKKAHNHNGKRYEQTIYQDTATMEHIKTHFNF
jgi:hypothetical protein